MIAREDVENAARELGLALSKSLEKRAGEPVGFALLVFDFGDGGSLAYMSNAERTGVIKAMKEFLQREGAL